MANRQAVDSSDRQRGKFGHRQRKRHYGEYRHRPILREKNTVACCQDWVSPRSG